MGEELVFWIHCALQVKHRTELTLQWFSPCLTSSFREETSLPQDLVRYCRTENWSATVLVLLQDLQGTAATSWSKAPPWYHHQGNSDLTSPTESQNCSMPSSPPSPIHDTGQGSSDLVAPDVLPSWTYVFTKLKQGSRMRGSSFMVETYLRWENSSGT